MQCQGVALPGAAEGRYNLVEFLASETQLSARQIKVQHPVTIKSRLKLRLGNQELILPGQIARRQ